MVAFGHYLVDKGVVNINACIERAPQIAIAKDADERAFAVGHGSESKAFAAHFYQRGGQRGALFHLREFVSLMHNVAHTHEQSATQIAAGVRESKVFASKTTCLE